MILKLFIIYVIYHILQYAFWKCIEFYNMNNVPLCMQIKIKAFRSSKYHKQECRLPRMSICITNVWDNPTEEGEEMKLLTYVTLESSELCDTKGQSKQNETALTHCAGLRRLPPLRVGVDTSDPSILVCWNWTIKQIDGGWLESSFTVGVGICG